MLQNAVEIGGEVDKISFRNEENGWTVLRLKTDQADYITVTGNFSTVREGEYIQLAGGWIENKKYGRQFKSAKRLPYNSIEGIKRYLCSKLIRGIGAKTAEKIVAHFGLDALKVLDATPHRLSEVPTIGPKKVETIMQAWQESRGHRDSEIFLITNGLTPNLAVKVIRKYGAATIDIVTENPYRLAAEIPRVGFLTADKIAQKLGIAADSEERIAAGILYQLQQAEDNGHLFLTTPQLLMELAATLRLAEAVLPDRLSPCLTALNQNGQMISVPYQLADGGRTTAHYQTELFVCERSVGDKIRQLLALPVEVDDIKYNRWLHRQDAETNVLTTDQMGAVKQALGSRAFILTGGPGVGKTTTANAIIQVFKEMGYSVALCAPTGRAAQRLTELTQVPASTIHRLLEWAPQVGGFQRGPANPLAAKVIIVDESSMLDIRLADALMQSVSDTSQIIFIGDVDQLPSVGPGNFLRDLIDSGAVPYTKLTEIFRQASTSQIIQTAHAINRGNEPHFIEDGKTDCRFIEVDSAEGIRKVVRELIQNILPTKCGYDPIADIQVLTPMNRGDLGTAILNDELQEALNPVTDFGVKHYKREGLSLRPGDKVIQSVNNYELNVFNGDIGFVKQCNVDGGKVIVSFADKTITYQGEDLFDLKLAYAITIHKSQGSEFPVVIMPLSMQHYIMLQRNLVYTGLTRAKKLAVFVGNKKSLELAIRNQSSRDRQTQLVEYLRGGAAEVLSPHTGEGLAF